MIDASTVDGLLKLVLALAKSGAPARQTRRSAAALEIFAFSCFVAAIVLALVAIGLAIAPRFGAAGALAVDAALAALIGLAAFAWTRRRTRARAPPAMGIPLETLVAEIWAHLQREKKGLSIVAGLLVGMFAAGSRD